MSAEMDPLDEREDAQKQVSDKRLLEELDAQGEMDQLAQLLENDVMRDFLWRVIGFCGPFSDPFDANNSKMSYNAGRASVGKWLMKEIAEANPEALLAMQLKANKAAALGARTSASQRLRKARRPSTTP